MKPRVSVLTPSIRPEYLDITQECLEKQTSQDFEWHIELGLRNRGFSLSRDLNKLLRRSQGEIIVMLQDCIRVEDNFIEECIKLYDQYPDTFITLPVGKVLKFEEDPKFDWRAYKEIREIPPQNWEADLAIAPRKAFYHIGGYDERYDEGWSWENCGIAYRAEKAGYKFLCVPDIKGVAIDHDALKPNPFRYSRQNNDKRALETLRLAQEGNYKLDYL